MQAGSERRRKRMATSPEAREHVRQTRMAYYYKNHAQEREKKRAYRLENLEKFRRESREYYAEHAEYRESRIPYRRVFYHKNITRERARGRVFARRRVQRIGHAYLHHWPELRAYFGAYCLCCGTNEHIEADHVIPVSCGGIHHISNIQPLCRSCNASKGAKTIDYRNSAQLASFLAQLPQ